MVVSRCCPSTSSSPIDPGGVVSGKTDDCAKQMGVCSFKDLEVIPHVLDLMAASTRYRRWYAGITYCSFSAPSNWEMVRDVGVIFMETAIRL